MIDEKRLIEETAKMYAESLILYGIDITEKWQTATSQRAALEQAYIRGKNDAYEWFKEDMWIPCSERLPKIGEECLVTLKVMCLPAPIFDEPKYETRLSIQKAPFLGNVIAWMPLAEPYELKGTEE